MRPRAGRFGMWPKISAMTRPGATRCYATGDWVFEQPWCRVFGDEIADLFFKPENSAAPW